jgi:hypothetical protein
VLSFLLDINQCLAAQGDCVSPALCIHTFGNNSCSFSTCSDASLDSGCVCSAGYWSSSKTIAACVACPASSYKPLIGFDSCTPCPTYAASPPASYLSSQCVCVGDEFQRSVDGTKCVQTDTVLPKDVGVKVTLSVQSKWTSSVPTVDDITSKGRLPFTAALLLEMSTALGIDVHRLAVADIQPDPDVPTSVYRNTGSGGMFVLVSCYILPANSAADGTFYLTHDSALDANGEPYSPALLAQFLEQLLSVPNSAVYSEGTSSFLSTTREGSLTAVTLTPPEEGQPGFFNSSLGTAVLFIGVILLAALVALVIRRRSPSEARVMNLATVVLAVMNQITNVIFIQFLGSHSKQSYDFTDAYYAAIVFFVLPIGLNVSVVTSRLYAVVFPPGPLVFHHQCRCTS